MQWVGSLVLSSCEAYKHLTASPEEIHAEEIAKERAECVAHGYKIGTELYLQCLKMIKTNRATTYRNQQRSYQNLGNMGR